MNPSWTENQAAFVDAADWFARCVARVGDRWSEPGLGEWDVRALVGHASRSFLTVETYLAQPPASVDVATTGDYYRATNAIAAGPGVAQRGRDAGAALGDEPVAALTVIASRVLPFVATCDGTELLTTVVGGMRLADYLPTRTFELTVHTCDLAVALGAPLDVPPSAADLALSIVDELAVVGGQAGSLLLLATGRTGGTSGFSVL